MSDQKIIIDKFLAGTTELGKFQKVRRELNGALELIEYLSYEKEISFSQSNKELKYSVIRFIVFDYFGIDYKKYEKEQNDLVDLLQKIRHQETI